MKDIIIRILYPTYKRVRENESDQYDTKCMFGMWKCSASEHKVVGDLKCKGGQYHAINTYWEYRRGQYEP
jgi:hypothetical protein